MHAGLFRTSALFAAVAALAGCGGGGSSSGTSGTALSGTAMAGPFLSGQACAYSVAGGAKGSLLGTCANISGSAFSIDIGDYTGDVLVEIAAGATYDDEANGGDGSTGTALTGSMRTLVHVATPGGEIEVVVTPLTEIAVRLAGATLDQASVQAAAEQLAAFLPLVSGFDLLGTVPLASTDLGLAYLQLLRALSQMQWQDGAGSHMGDLNAYLNNLLGQMGSEGNTVAADLLAELAEGLDGQCAVNGGSLSCTASSGGGGGGGGVSCNTSLVPAGSTPTSQQLASFARTYNGSEGTYDDYFTFTATGSATLVFNNDGSATYNGAAYGATSYCLETLPNDAGQMLVIHANGGLSHFDLFSDGVWTGIAPSGKAVTDQPYGG